jgi:hypothetical protein
MAEMNNLGQPMFGASIASNGFVTMVYAVGWDYAIVGVGTIFRAQE